MSKLPFRTDQDTPSRNYNGYPYKDYRRFKEYLRKDFKKKCGYTNCYDEWFGGIGTFQIDHFLPQETHPELVSEYSNLVYCCSYVNRAKSNLVSEKFLDPCEEDYNEHFYRNEKGEIFPVASSEAAKYMHKTLQLFLSRYSIIWMLERLENKMYQLQELIENSDDSEAKELLVDVTCKYNDYKKYLRAQ